jgi:hypothetical protein
MMASFPRCRARLATRWAAAKLRHRHATSLTQTMNRVAVMLRTPSSVALSPLHVFGNRDAKMAMIKINMLEVHSLRRRTKIGQK